MESSRGSRLPASGRSSLSPPLSDASLLGGGSFVAGSFSGASSGRAVSVLNPADGGVVSRVASVTAGDLDLAVSSSAAAFDKWRRVSAASRAAFLWSWASLLKAYTMDLAHILTLENGKPLAESRAEVDYATSYIEWYAGEATRSASTFTTSPSSTMRGIVVREPVGVVVAITPCNLPVAMITRKVAAALSAGCTVIAKPSDETPLTSLMLAVLAHRAGGLPAGGFNVVVCRADAASRVVSTLLTAPPVAAVTLTGSCRAGAEVGRLAAERVLRTSFELGSGGAPFVVFDDADLTRAVDDLMRSKFRAAGQTCIAADRVLVQEGVHDEFVRRLRERIGTLRSRMGNGMVEGVELGPLVNSAAVLRVARVVEDAVVKGANLEAGGIAAEVRRRHERTTEKIGAELPSGPRVVVNGVGGEGNDERAKVLSFGVNVNDAPVTDDGAGLPEDAAGSGCFFPPTLLTGLSTEMELFQGEIFGPVIGVQKFAREGEMLQLLTDAPESGGLAAYVYTENIGRADRTCRALSVGMVAVNNVALSDPRTPFGGVGSSGHGREGGPRGIEEFSYSKYILHSL